MQCTLPEDYPYNTLAPRKTPLQIQINISQMRDNPTSRLHTGCKAIVIHIQGGPKTAHGVCGNNFVNSQ